MSGFTASNAAPTAAPIRIPSRTNVQMEHQVIEAFADNPSLVNSIGEFIVSHPQPASAASLFRRIAQHVLDIRAAVKSEPPATNGHAIKQEPSSTPQPSKKRKIDDPVEGSSSTSAAAGWQDRTSRPDFVAPDISFSVPQRKKLRLECISSSTGGLRASNPAGDNLEFGMAWSDVEAAFCLPVPEKAKKQHNLIVIPKDSAATGSEAMVWTVNESAATEGNADAEPAKTARYLSSQLARFNREVIFPDEAEFKSAMPNIKKGEMAFHVKAHRGSKEGFLFFLGPGIFWGFKKPLLFMPFSVINSTSYTSVLQRTFNLNISITATVNGEPQEPEIEFGMIDQADFAGIDQYIKAHQLHDASLAEQRKAKVYGVNNGRKVKTEEGAEGENREAQDAEMEDGETELQRAERLLQDQEDEEEEDYVDEEEEEEEGSSEEEDYGEGAYNDGGGGDEEEEEDEGDE